MTRQKKGKSDNTESLHDSYPTQKSDINDLFDKISSTEESTSVGLVIQSDPCLTPTYLTYKAYERMVGYAIRYANKNLSKNKWREVYGILTGSIEDEKRVIVKDAIPVCVGDRAGVELEPIHYVDISQIDAATYERAIENKNTDFIIGWWHTHPGFSFFFSEVDKITHLGYQVPNPFAIGLIFDHCEKEEKSLGVAALRLKKPERGILSTHRIVELQYELDKKKINQKINKKIELINKNIGKVEKELVYIEDTLINKGLKQLKKDYGLILVPKEDITLTDEEVEKIELINKSYVWPDSDSFKDSYQVPKFREKVENRLKEFEDNLIKIKESNQLNNIESQRKKFKEKIKNMLDKPKELHDRITDEFNKHIEIISPYFDYLDTNERKLIENFEEKMSEYSDILVNLNKRAEEILDT